MRNTILEARFWDLIFTSTQLVAGPISAVELNALGTDWNRVILENTGSDSANDLRTCHRPRVEKK